MSLSIDNFRTRAAELGGGKLQTDQQGEGIVRSGKTAWIKSLLNIGSARQDNARTIAALRQAVHNDPRYARVTAQADSLLGRMNVKTPLTGRKVTQFLNQLDADAQKADNALIAQNKALVSSYAMREIGALDRYAARCGGGEFHMSPDEKKELTLVMSNRIMQYAGDFKTVSCCEDNIKAIVQNTMQEFVNLRVVLDSSPLPPNIKGIMKDQFFEDGELMSRETLGQRIQIRKTIQANQTLQQSLSDVSTGDAPLRKALSEAMDKAGITVGISDRVLEGLGAAIRAAIEKAGKMGQHAVSTEEGEALVNAQVKTFIDAYQMAGTLGSPAEQAFMRNLVLTSAIPISPAYLQALSEHAAKIPVAAFAALANASTPAHLMDAIESISRLLEEGYSSLGDALKQEGAEGRASYLEHCLELALAHGGMNAEKAKSLFDGLNTPMSKELRGMLDFASSEHPAMASAKVTLLTAMQALGRVGGMDLDAFMHEEFTRPVPLNVGELSLDLRALLPGFNPVGGNVPLGQAPDLDEALRSARQRFVGEMVKNIQIQMMHHMNALGGKNDSPTFEKDITRQGLRLTLGGTTLQHFRDIPEESLLLPGETSISKDELTRRRQAATVLNGYNAFAKLVTGRDDAVFSELSSQDKTKVLILTSMANQETEKSALFLSLRAVIPEYMSDSPEGFAISNPIEIISQRDMEFDITPDGDFVIRLHSKVPVDAMGLNSGDYVQVDPARSNMTVASTLTISRAEMERLAQLNWNLTEEEYMDLPETHHIHFTEHSLTGGMQLFTAQ